MRIITLLAALLAIAALAACGSESSTAPPAPTSTLVPVPTATLVPTPAYQGGVLKLLGSDPPTLDPHQTGDVTSSRYVLEVFGGLLTIDPASAIVSDIAEDWDIDPDGRVYTFRLNPNAVFHDGRKVTASDFQYSFERASDPALESPSADTFLGDIVGVMDKLEGAVDSISGVTVIDEETLRVETDAAKAYFLSKMTYPTSFVVDRANVETGTDWVRSPNGTGPFMLSDYEPGVLIRLERFGGYHLGPPNLDAVEFNLAGGDGMLMYENDELHFGQVGLATLERLQEPTDPLHNQLHQGPPRFDTVYIGMNSNEPPFDDVNVRLALNHAIDRDTLASVLLENTVVPAMGILPPGFPGYNPDLDSYEYDPEKARQLLAESSYGSDTASYPPITITLPGSFGSSASPSIEAILFGWEEQLGITMEILQTEWATYLQDLQDRRFQVFGGLGWAADYPDPENFLDVLFHGESSNNHTHYSDPELDALLEQARVEPDQDARFELYHQAEQKILDGAPWVPIWHSNGENYLIKPYVKGLPLSPLIIPRLRYVYLDQ